MAKHCDIFLSYCNYTGIWDKDSFLEEFVSCLHWQACQIYVSYSLVGCSEFGFLYPDGRHDVETRIGIGCAIDLILVPKVCTMIVTSVWSLWVSLKYKRSLSITLCGVYCTWTKLSILVCTYMLLIYISVCTYLHVFGNQAITKTIAC